MQVKYVLPAHRDHRGCISDILVDEPIDCVTVISSSPGATRGNHYHKLTTQWVYVHSGKIKALAQTGDGPVVYAILEPGGLVRNDKMEKHALVALEESVFYVFAKGPRGGGDYEIDTYRLDAPLKEGVAT